MKDTDAARRVRQYVLDHPGPFVVAAVIDETGAKGTSVHSALHRLAEVEPELLERAPGGRYAGWISHAGPPAPVDAYPTLKQSDGLTVVGTGEPGVYVATDDITGHLWAVVPAVIMVKGGA
jgi:hypothetical protein